MVAFATQVKRRRGTTAQNDAFTGAEGEIVVDTEKHELRVHDGVTRGGHIIPTNETLDFATKSLDNLSQEGEARFSEKANTNMDNITSTGKETVVSWGMPDYSAGVSKSNNTQYTSDKDGFLYAYGFTQSAIVSVIINGINMPIGGRADIYGGGACAFIPISKGDTYKFGGNASTITFYPCKGAI